MRALVPLLALALRLTRRSVLLPSWLRHSQPAETCLSHQACMPCSPFLPFRAASHLLFILQTLSAPVCIFCSAPPLSVLSSPCAFHLVFLSRFFLLPSPSPSCIPFPLLFSFFSPGVFSIWHSALLYGKLLESIHSQMPLTASYATGQHKLCITQIHIKLPH